MTATHPTGTVQVDFDTDLAAGVGYHEQVAVSAPYAYYRLKETSGTFADASGNGKTGTGAGTVDYNETSGNPVTGDATARYVLFTTDTTRIGLTGVVPQSGAITVEAFIYVTSLAVDRFIFENDGTLAANNLIEFWVETTGALSARGGNSNMTVTSTAGDIATGTWYHVAAVFNAPAKTITFYKNGALLTSGIWNTTRGSATSLSNLNTSWHWGTDSSSSKGSVARLAEPAIYLRALTAAEFGDHYLALAVAPFAGYTWTDVTSYVMWKEPFSRQFGRSSEVADVVAMQLEYTLRNDDRRFEGAEDAIDLVDDDDFEINTGGWDPAGVGGIARVTTQAKYGAASLRITAASAGNSGARFNTAAVGNPVPQEPHSFSVWVKAEGAAVGRTVRVVMEESGGAFGDETMDLAEMTLTAGWQQIQLENTPVRADRTALYLFVLEMAALTGEIIYIDGAVLAQQPLPIIPNVVPGRPTRVQMTQDGDTYDWAFGFIEDWPQQWDSAGKFCRVPIRASCFLADLNEEDIGARDFVEQTAGARLTVLLNAAGYPTTMRDLDTGANTLMALTSDTNTVGVHASAIARTDRGLFYFDGRGYATFHDGNHRTTDARSTSSQGNLGDDIPYSAPEFHAPKDRIRNEITLRRPGGVDQTVTDQTSRNRYRKRSYSDEIHLTTDAAVATRATELLTAYKGPHLRVQAVTFNPATPPGYWPHALGVQLSDRYTWQFRPEQGRPLIRPVFVEGFRDSYQAKVYTSTWFLSVV